MRLGFQRLLAEVSLDHVGLILGLELSRLARSNKDWHQLLELWALFGTLLADADGLYDPTDYNDRLLLGLRGMMNEAELYILKGRLHASRLNKAKGAALLNHPPMGYVRGTDRDYHLDPDEQAQRVMRLIFEVFEQQGSLHGLLRYLVAHDSRLPIRPHHGSNRGQLEWHRPNRMTLQTMLHHPIYAGAYRWGYRKIDPRKQQPGRPNTGKTVNAPESCEVFIQDRFPAYISWERFDINASQEVYQNQPFRNRPDRPVDARVRLAAWTATKKGIGAWWSCHAPLQLYGMARIKLVSDDNCSLPG